MRKFIVLGATAFGLTGCMGGMSAANLGSSVSDSHVFTNQGGSDGNGNIGSVTGSGSNSSNGSGTLGSVTGSGTGSNGGGGNGGNGNLGPITGSGTAPTCSSTSLADIAALSNALIAANSPANSSSDLNSCEATLNNNFSASTTDSTGKVTNFASPSDSASAIGVNCAGSWQSTNTSLILDKFADDNLRSAGGNGPTLTKTDICKAGTAAPCSPTSSGFLFEIQWTADNNVSQVVAAEATVTSTDLTCDGGTQLISPLVIEDEPGQGITTLNPFSTETFFDLTGNGVESRISCVQRGAFLALPNQNGQIENINQLFGNNTLGPDGKKASNGFLALGKYDANGDGVIDERDPVFRDLVVWEDLNCDGVAQPNEISSLARRGIASITWADAIHMYEVDQWGNATEERNVVQLVDSVSSKIFDLWFKPY